MSRKKGREVQKKLVSLSPFTNSIIKDYAVYHKITDSTVVEEAVISYVFQGADVGFAEILKKEIYRSETLDSTFYELFKYASRKKHKYIPNLAKLLEEIQNAHYEEVALDDEMKKKLFDTFGNVAKQSDGDFLYRHWCIFRKSAETYPETFHISELFEWFALNADCMNRYSVKEIVKVLSEAYPCRNTSENRIKLIEGIVNIETAGEDV